MRDINGTISTASDSGRTLSVRHEAFAELVLRFQDMAFACAYAVLGDAYLAEDVAQEAFVAAWQKLDQLREPSAFAGWFKRIVLSQCNRVTRGKRLQIVPLEAGEGNASNDPGPHLMAEKQELLDKVVGAIKALPEKERLVTTLFYVNGYTQMDIGNFLEVPVSTVNKRLHTARQRLKESVAVFKDNLKTQRPSRDSSFADRVNQSLRPLVKEDWPPIKSMADARERTDLPGNDIWLRRRQDFDEDNYVRRQYVAENPESGQILGFGSIEQSIYLPKYRLFVVTNPRWLKLGVGDLLLERLTNDLNEANAVTVACREYASQTELLKFLRDRGFKETDRVIDSRLELAGRGRGSSPTVREGVLCRDNALPDGRATAPKTVPTLDVSSFSKITERMEATGITISTLAEERARDTRCVEKLYALTTNLQEDDPARAPFAPPAYNAREALLWLNMSYVLPDAYFIAKHGHEYVGVSDVSLYEALPGGVTHGFTGVRREYRRQGIATALMLREIEYAGRHGYKIIQSLNRPEQSEVLALQQRLGFQVLSSRVTLEKCLKKVIEVDPRIYDEYAGRYRDDERPDLELIVRNEGGRLTIEAVGQKVELFPTSESQFFVKQFYGEATFVHGEQGRVDLLKFEMPEYKTRKASVQLAKRINHESNQLA